MDGCEIEISGGEEYGGKTEGWGGGHGISGEFCLSDVSAPTEKSNSRWGLSSLGLFYGR